MAATEKRRVQGVLQVPRNFEDRAEFGKIESWIRAWKGGREALAHCRRFAENSRGVSAPLLMGPSGCGKSHLVWAMAREIQRRALAGIDDALRKAEEQAQSQATEVDRGFLPIVVWPDVHLRVISGADLAASFRDAVKSSSIEDLLEDLSQRRLLARPQAVSVLIIDDIEVPKSSPWFDENLYRLVDFRYNQRFPTSVCSNLLPEELRGALGDRVVRRLQDMTEPFVFSEART